MVKLLLLLLFKSQYFKSNVILCVCAHVHLKCMKPGPWCVFDATDGSSIRKSSEYTATVSRLFIFSQILL